MRAVGLILIVLGLFLAIFLLLGVNVISFFGNKCYFIGQIKFDHQDHCIPEPLYFFFWLAAIGSAVAGAMMQLTKAPVSSFWDASPNTGTSGALETTPQRSTRNVPLDREKWNALLRFDPDIAAVAEKLKRLGPKWIDELGAAYLALNDKTYLPDIVQKLLKEASEEEEANRRAAEEQKQRADEAQKRLAEQRTIEEERRRLKEDRLRVQKRETVKLLRQVLRSEKLAEFVHQRWIVIISSIAIIFAAVLLIPILHSQIMKETAQAATIAGLTASNGARVELQETVILGDYALVHWRGGGESGEAVLIYIQDKWFFVIKAAGYRCVNELVKAGISRDTAASLLKKTTYGRQC